VVDSFECSADCFRILIIGCHIQLNVKPASLLKFLGCNCISIASPTIPVGGCPGQSMCFFSNRISYSVCYIIQLMHFVSLQNTLTLTFKNTKMLKHVCKHKNILVFLNVKVSVF